MPDNLTPPEPEAQRLPRIVRWNEIRPGGVPEPRDAVERAVRSQSYFEFGGGLGDVISASSRSSIIAKLDDGIETVVTIVSHNPHCWEIFGYHANAARATIIDIPYREVQGAHGFWSREFRDRYGLPCPPPTNPPRGRGDGFRFHAPPWDLEEIRRVRPPYVVFSPTASMGPSDKRTIPERILGDAISTALDAGLLPVVIGCDYTINGSETRHREKPVCRDGVLSMVGRLTVPGSAELMRRAVASVVCDSAMGCAAAAMSVWRFSLISDEMWRACSGPQAGHGEIMSPKNYQCRFGVFDPALLREFLGKSADEFRVEAT